MLLTVSASAPSVAAVVAVTAPEETLSQLHDRNAMLRGCTRRVRELRANRARRPEDEPKIMGQ